MEVATELKEQPEKAGGWLLPSEEFVAVFVEQRARAVVPPGPQEEVAAELPVGAAWLV